MGQYFPTIGDGAHGFVAGPNGTGSATLGKDGWLHTSNLVVQADGWDVDMTDVPVGERRKVGGYTIERTERGVRAISTHALNE